MKRKATKILLLFIFIFVTFQLFSQNTTEYDTTLVDTVYLAPDTIKTTRTVIVYEDEQPTPQTLKIKQPNLYLANIGSGLQSSYIYPQYNKIGISSQSYLNFSVFHEKLFMQIGLQYNTTQTNKASLKKHFTTYNHYFDTTKIFLDEFTQIIGKDTIIDSAFKTVITPKTDTVHTDSTYFHQNRYQYISIPFIVGYCKKGRKDIYGVGIGVNCRHIMISESNKIARTDIEEFQHEKSVIRKWTFDGLLYGYYIKKIKKRLWFHINSFLAIPLLSEYKNYTKNMYQVQLGASIGLSYKVDFHYKKIGNKTLNTP